MATTKTTAVATKKSSNIVSIGAQLKALAAQTADRTEASIGSTIRISQSKEFALPDGNKTRDPIDVVVVDYTCKNVFYETTFDPKKITPPACFAISTNPKNMVPSPNSPVPQAKSCNECPNNQFGSASDGKAKACNNTRVLAVTPPHIKRDADGKPVDSSPPLWLLNVSKTAYKRFDLYVQEAARLFEVPPVGTIVTVGFDDNVTYPSLTFSNVMPNPDVEDHFPLMETAARMLAVEPDVSKYEKKPVVRSGRR